MTLRVAQMAGGVIVKIFREGTDANVDLGDRTVAFRHLRTWVAQGDQMLTRYNLVGITTSPPPAYNSRTHILRRIEPQIGSSTTADTWQLVTRETNQVRSELINDIKDRAWELWGRASWTMGRAAWFDYRDTLKTYGLSMVQAHDAGQTVDVQTGAINGAGAWPTT